MKTRDRIIEILKNWVMPLGNTKLIGIPPSDILFIADEILALPLYEREFVEYAINHRDLEIRLGFNGIYQYWKDLPENKEK